jgi:folate-binding protein YgfZ
MLATALHDALSSSAIRMADYRGAETAALFSDVTAELDALRTGAGVYDLGWRAKIIVTGPDRVRWMNGMVTNNIQDLPESQGVYCFLLNVQGRIQGDMYVYNRGEHLLIDTDVSQKERLLGIFDKYIIMDDVEVTDASERLAAIGVRGPLSQDVLKKAGAAVEGLGPLQLQDRVVDGLGISVVRGEREQICAYELWMAPENAAPVWEKLVAAGAKPIGTEALELARIAAGVPRYGQDIRERDLPQETEQNQALHFRKGCYVGQEIVERIHSRGQVHRKFTGFVFSGKTPAPGSKLQSGGKDIGEITSVASVPARDGAQILVALGYIRRELGTPGAEVEAGGVTGKVANLPIESI